MTDTNEAKTYGYTMDPDGMISPSRVVMIIEEDPKELSASLRDKGMPKEAIDALLAGIPVRLDVTPTIFGPYLDVTVLSGDDDGISDP